jgi:hypothetical protein
MKAPHNIEKYQAQQGAITQNPVGHLPTLKRLLQ